MTDLFPAFDTLIVLDTETTGVNAQHDEIIELGAVRLRRDGAEFVADADLSCLIRLPTGRTVPPMIEKITGISQAMLDADGVGRRELSLLFSGKVRPGRLSARIEISRCADGLP